MTSSSLTIVGGSARAAAQSAVRAGFSPFAGDIFGDEDLRHLCPTTRVAPFPAGLLKVCAGPQPGDWIYTGALENHPGLIRRMSQIRPLLGNGAEVVRRVRDPFTLTAALAEAGFPTLSISRTAEGLPRDGRWLRKPIRSAGGAEISRWDANSADTRSAKYYFQEFATGDACGAVFVGGTTDASLLGVTRQLPNRGDSFLYHGSIGPIDLSPEIQRQFEQLGAFLAKEFQLVGLFGVDVVLRDDTIWPLEVNPRYTASVEVLERSLNLPAIAWHVAGCRKQPLPHFDRTTATATVGKQILYAPSELTLPVELLRFVANENSKNSWPTYCDLPAAGSLIPAGWPILTVLASAVDQSAVLESLREFITPLIRFMRFTHSHFSS